MKYQLIWIDNFGIYILFILDIKEDNYCLIMFEQFVNMMKMQPIIQFKNQGHKSKNLKKDNTYNPKIKYVKH